MNNKYFSKEKQEKALKWLEEKWKKDRRACEVCGNDQWTLIEDLVMPLPFVGGDITLGGNSYPHILITCINCGNSKLFNAVALKIVGQGKEAQNG